MRTMFSIGLVLAASRISITAARASEGDEPLRLIRVEMKPQAKDAA